MRCRSGSAHCINGGKGSSGYNSDIVFIPDYRDGQEPFGYGRQQSCWWRRSGRVRQIPISDSANVPITCVNLTSRFSSTQLRFDCGGYTGGTSGSPWVTKFSPGSHAGTIVGVIGGYQQGGDTPSVSSSVRFGPAILALYRQAVAAEATVSSR